MDAVHGAVADRSGTVPGDRHRPLSGHAHHFGKSDASLDPVSGPIES